MSKLSDEIKVNTEDKKTESGFSSNIVGAVIWIIIILFVANKCGFTDSLTDGSDQEVYIEYLSSQIEYANKHNIQLNRFTSKEKALAEWLQKDKGSMINIAIEYNLFSEDEFKITEDEGEYIYCGELNDNRPHGYGMLFKPSEVSYGLITYENRYYDILYIGEFSKGRYDGFGMIFDCPEETTGGFESLCPYEKGTDEFNEYYLIWENRVEYFGEFSKGKAEGDGNSFSLIDLNYFGDHLTKDDFLNMDYTVSVGDFASQELDGKGKIYISGFLYYDGELKEGKMHGKGTLYYSGTDQIEYEGEYKKDMRHGKGTSYSENGDIIYEGEWKNDDYK